MGEGFEIGVAKASTGSYRRRLEVQNSDTAKVAVDVVVNDEQMSAKAAVSDLWYRSDEPDVETTVHRDLNVAELAALFETATALVHYVGHVEERGVSCADGYLDARTLDDVGVGIFILNACTSSHQGKHLVDEGAIAGVVTLDAVPNETATRVGKDVARLVNFGLPVTNAIDIVRETVVAGSSYLVVGDTTASIAHSNTSIPNVTRVTLGNGGHFDVTVEVFATLNAGVGSVYRPYIDGCDRHFIVPGELDTWTVDDEALDEVFDISPFPVIADGDLFWSDDVTSTELRERLEDTT